MYGGKLDSDYRAILQDRPRYGADDMLSAAFYCENDKVLAALDSGADVNQTDEQTGLSALHIAVGSNNMPLVKALVEKYSAKFFADGFGRWPSVVAIECKASDQMLSYIWDEEAKFLGLSTA